MTPCYLFLKVNCLLKDDTLSCACLAADVLARAGTSGHDIL